MVREVQGGDNLWNIAKEEYKLTNNTDIAKTVKDIQSTNKIKDANLIYKGDNLELPKETSGGKRVDAIDENELVAEFVEWVEEDSTEANKKKIDALNSKLSQALKQKREGKITNEQYQKIRQEIMAEKEKVGSFNMKSADEFSSQIMNVLDKNGDGKVTFAEFKAAVIRRMSKEEATSEATLKKINDQFALVDIDKNDTLTADEVKDLLTFMDFQDKSKDGNITKTAYNNISSPQNTEDVQKGIKLILRRGKK